MSARHSDDGASFLGVDVGGTFTDLVFYDTSGQEHCFKVPSTPRTPGVSTLNGIDEIRNLLGLARDDWRGLHHTHSSTVATNALIERSGAVIGLLTTDGFRDLFELQRLTIPEPLRFDSRRPTPLVPRSRVREVFERIDASGNELTPLDEEATVRAAVELKSAGVEIILICFLHSYRNPAHEEQAKALIEANVDELAVELSSAVWPQAREYERATLGAVNAYVRPTVEAYLDELLAGLADRGIATPARVSRSNGGMELAATMRERPVVALLSGPAAGVSGAASAAAAAGWPDADLVTVDVGGTSADIGVIRAGKPVLSSEEHIADFPLLIPTVAVSSIGAGGGSQLWVDSTGTLKVGPRSVGSDPGPACYGLGKGEVAALTDAFLLAGLLSPGQRLGGRLELQFAPAERVLGAIAGQIGGDAASVADAAIQIAVAMMAAEATAVLSRRGVDVPQFKMVAFGGAGPIVAALLAEEIYVDEVLVPPRPGALSAWGAARANLAGDVVTPIYRLLAELAPEELSGHYRDLSDRVSTWLDRELATLEVDETHVGYSANMRYDGQGYDVVVDLKRTWLERQDMAAIAAEFHRAHQAAYGHRNEAGAIWLKELHAHVTGSGAQPVQPLVSTNARSPRMLGTRTIRIRGVSRSATVYARSALVAGTEVSGPAIIEQMDTTTLVPPQWRARVVSSGSIILARG